MRGSSLKTGHNILILRRSLFFETDPVTIGDQQGYNQNAKYTSKGKREF